MACKLSVHCFKRSAMPLYFWLWICFNGLLENFRGDIAGGFFRQAGGYYQVKGFTIIYYTFGTLPLTMMTGSGFMLLLSCGTTFTWSGRSVPAIIRKLFYGTFLSLRHRK